MVHQRRCAVEDEVAGQQRRTGGDMWPGVVLRLRRPRHLHTGGGIGSVRQPRAVEADVGGGRSVAAPLVRQADLRAGEGYRPLRR